MLRFWLTEGLSHWGTLQKRERCRKKQFTWPVMFSVPIAVMEEICLNSSFFLPSSSSPLAFQPSLNLVFMMSVCCHGSSSVTDVLWLHWRMEAEENWGWKRTAQVNLRPICSAKKDSLHLYVQFEEKKKRLVKPYFVEGWPFINVAEITTMPKSQRLGKKCYAAGPLGLWRVVKICVLNPVLR